jgi:hypothetical protein
MRCLMEFYNERRGILARYAIEAALPAAAVVLGRNAVLANLASRQRRRHSCVVRMEPKQRTCSIVRTPERM